MAPQPKSGSGVAAWLSILTLRGDIDLLLNRRAVIGAFPWRLVDGESCICRILAFVPEDEHDALMAKKARAKLTRFGDVSGSDNGWLHDEARRRG